MKKYDLPAMPFYWGDWFKCPEVRALSPAARCLWFEMLGLMWESTERGYLTLNGKPMTKETLSRCLGFASDLLDVLLLELNEFGVYSVRDDGAIYNRRMVRDAEISKERAIAGQKGGFCSSKKHSKRQANIPANTEDEDEDEIETEIEDVTAPEKKSVSSDPDQIFTAFWKMYPLKVGKGAALKAWGHISAPAETLEKIRGALEWQKKTEQWTKDNGQFIPHPSTYLNQRRWEDEPLTPYDGLKEWARKNGIDDAKIGTT